MPGDAGPSEEFAKSIAVTESERYLGELCERNFLSLWSYPRPFRDQGGGKELCDLLVVMGHDVIVFSDKHCALVPKSGLEVDWSRWFRSAVWSGAKQAWGAARWLREQPERVFLDEECTRPLPVALPDPDSARYHLVVTVHGVSAACRAMLGGTGSLILATDVHGLDAQDRPFVVGDLDPARPFVHVLDDTTLDIVMSTLDTMTDFIRYLTAKEKLCRSRATFWIAGEENLLAHYVTHVDEAQQHAFIFDDPEADLIVLDESLWEDFESSAERRSQAEHDQISYSWDRLIERFATHTMAGTQYHATEPAFESSEKILRFMAAEPRLHRRALSEALLEAIENTPTDQRRIRVIPPWFPADPMYVFLILPWREDKPEDENRAVRRHFLEACMYVAKMKYPQAEDIVGIATEAGLHTEHRSEDAIYFDARQWSNEDHEMALNYQRDYEILVAEKEIHRTFMEYPEGDRGEDAFEIPKNPRNKPCPCGSGRKYKHCHGS